MTNIDLFQELLDRVVVLEKKVLDLEERLTPKEAARESQETTTRGFRLGEAMEPRREEFDASVREKPPEHARLQVASKPPVRSDERQHERWRSLFQIGR